MKGLRLKAKRLTSLRSNPNRGRSNVLTSNGPTFYSQCSISFIYIPEVTRRVKPLIVVDWFQQNFETPIPVLALSLQAFQYQTLFEH